MTLVNTAHYIAARRKLIAEQGAQPTPSQIDHMIRLIEAGWDSETTAWLTARAGR